MKNLILVGGISYCGKSTLCEKLQEKDKETFHHIEFDRLYDEIHHDGAKFFKYFKIVEPLFYDKVKVQCARDGILDPDQQLQFYGALAFQSGMTQEFGVVIENIGVAYLSDVLAHSKESPVIEGLLVNKEARQHTYEALKSHYAHFREEDSPELDEVRKLLVFFDVGLRRSLKRFKRGGRKKFESLTSNERLIRDQHKKQELPEKDELPNLEIMVITDPSKIDQYAAQIAKDYSPKENS